MYQEGLINLPQIRHNIAQRFAEPLVKVLCKTGVTPNVLTLIGFLCSLGAAVSIALGYPFIGGFVVLLSGAFDLLDGALARAKQQSTRFGALLDSTLDRLSEASVLFGLLILNLKQPLSPLVWLIYVVIILSMLVSYIRARAEGLGMKCEVGILSRAERIIILTLGLLLTPVYAHSVLGALCILAGLTAITVIQRLMYVWQQTKSSEEN